MLVLSIGLYVSRKKMEDTESYFLAGRSMGWFAVGASLFVTNISGEHLIGLAGSGADRGFVVGHFEWLAVFAILLLGWIFAPIYRKAGIVTTAEFLEKRFNRASRVYLASISIVMYILTKISVTLFAGGILLNAMFGWSIYTSAVVIVIITGIYTIIGGLRAVILTQVVQAGFLILGSIIVMIISIDYAGGVTNLQTQVSDEFFSMFKPLNDPDYPWLGIVFGAPILAVWYWCTDQYIVQRVLSAKNMDHVKSASLFAGFLKILPVFLFVLPGIAVITFIPQVKGDSAYPLLLGQLPLIAGFRGLVTVGILSALMSSLASVFNSAATLFTNDLYKPFKNKISERELVLVGRLATVFMVVTGIMWVPLTKLINSHIYLYLQSIQAYISPPIAAVFVFGILSKKVNARGAMYTLVVGGILGFIRLILEFVHKSLSFTNTVITWIVNFNFLYFAIILFFISVTVLYAASAINPAEPAMRYAEIKKIGFKNYDKNKWQLTNMVFAIVLLTTLTSLLGIFF